MDLLKIKHKKNKKIKNKHNRRVYYWTNKIVYKIRLILEEKERTLTLKNKIQIHRKSAST